MKFIDDAAHAQHSQTSALSSTAEDTVLSDVEQNVTMTNDGAHDNPQPSQQKSSVKTHSSSPTEPSVSEDDGDGSATTEAEPRYRISESSPARPDNPATVSWLEGDVLDQAKGPPALIFGPGGISARRREHDDLDIHNSDADDDSSKA